MLCAGTTEKPELPQCENVQERSISREVDLAWLAGIIDGEGNLDFSVSKKKCGDGLNDYFCPKLRITNTDVRMIRKISEIYSRENVVFFYALNSVKRYKNRQPTWKNQLEITSASHGSVKKVLSLTFPYLVNKQDLARQMIETIDWVQSQPGRGRMSQTGRNYTMEPKFHAFLESLKKERAFHVDPSTITRKAREVISW